MANETNQINLDSLLLQSALETEELVQQKDDLRQQIQICKANIQEKKNCIEEILKTINKLDEEILQRRNTVKCHKENAKSLRKTSELMLHYEKMLEAELEQRQQSYETDMKMFKERMENYKKVFQQHKEGYCQNPLAAKLLKIQSENEEIEKRIQATDEQIVAKRKELKALKGERGTFDSGPRSVESNNQKEVAPENDSYSEGDKLTKQDVQPQGTQTGEEDVQIVREETSENNQEKADGSDESKEWQVGVLVSPFDSTFWTRTEIRCEQIQETEQTEQEQTSELDGSQYTSSVAGILEEVSDDNMEAEEQHESTGASEEDSINERAACPPSSPVRMTAVLETPTFSLNSSPSTSVSHQERPETPPFVLSMISEPDTSAFSGFGCNFHGESSQHEGSSFTITSSYFSNKKSPEPKIRGFLFDESECRTEQDFPFNFSLRSPQASSSTKDTLVEKTREAFPFSFKFGKF